MAKLDLSKLVTAEQKKAARDLGDVTAAVEADRRILLDALVAEQADKISKDASAPAFLKEAAARQKARGAPGAQ